MISGWFRKNWRKVKLIGNNRKRDSIPKKRAKKKGKKGRRWLKDIKESYCLLSKYLRSLQWKRRKGQNKRAQRERRKWIKKKCSHL